MNKYADIILPLSLDGTFTYLIPDEIQSTIQVGMRVLVNFGSKKFTLVSYIVCTIILRHTIKLSLSNYY